jgi:cation transport regulator ChaB
VPTAHRDDFYSWALEQAQALRRAAAERVNTAAPIDWENVAEEIESMGNEQAWKLKSSYTVLLLHLLEWRYQPKRRTRSWRITIGRERDNVLDWLRASPGLKSRRHELFAWAYERARRDAMRETSLPLRSFPEACPFTLEQAMDEAFWPEAGEHPREPA